MGNRLKLRRPPRIYSTRITLHIIDTLQLEQKSKQNVNYLSSSARRKIVHRSTNARKGRGFSQLL